MLPKSGTSFSLRMMSKMGGWEARPRYVARLPRAGNHQARRADRVRKEPTLGTGLGKESGRTWLVAVEARRSGQEPLGNCTVSHRATPRPPTFATSHPLNRHGFFVPLFLQWSLRFSRCQPAPGCCCPCPRSPHHAHCPRPRPPSLHAPCRAPTPATLAPCQPGLSGAEVLLLLLLLDDPIRETREPADPLFA
jgi:hypothetical protein